MKVNWDNYEFVVDVVECYVIYCNLRMFKNTHLAMGVHWLFMYLRYL